MAENTSAKFTQLVENTKAAVAAARTSKDEATQDASRANQVLTRVERQTPLLSHVREQFLSQMRNLQQFEALIESKSEALAARATEMRRRSVDVISELEQSLRVLERVRVAPGLLDTEAPHSLADFVEQGSIAEVRAKVEEDLAKMNEMAGRANVFANDLSTAFNLIKKTISSLSLPNTKLLREQVSDEINGQLRKIDEIFVALVTVHDRGLSAFMSAPQRPLSDKEASQARLTQQQLAGIKAAAQIVSEARASVQRETDRLETLFTAAAAGVAACEEFGAKAQNFMMESAFLERWFTLRERETGALLADMANLASWYRNTVLSYDALLPEVRRRQQQYQALEAKLAQVNQQFAEMQREEQGRQAAFNDEYVKYLPPALTAKLPPTFPLYQLTSRPYPLPRLDPS